MTHVPRRSLTVASTLIFLAMASLLAAQPPTTTTPPIQTPFLHPIALTASGDCPTCTGDNHMDGSFPYVEEISGPTATLTSTTGSYDPGTGLYWNTISNMCFNAQRRANPNFIFQPNDTSYPFNAILRAYTRLDTVSPSTSTGRYEIRFVVDGQPRGQYLRRPIGVTPDGETFQVIVANVQSLLGSTGHYVTLQAAVVDSGMSISFGQVFLTGQGVPSYYPASNDTQLPVQLPVGFGVNSDTATVSSSWNQITSTISFTNAIDVNLAIDGYLQFNSGTPGDHIALGFSLDGANSQHTIQVAVPAVMPDGINFLDHIKDKQPGVILNVPATSPGTQHTLSVWAIDRDGGTETVQFRQVEFAALPANEYSTNNFLPMLDIINTTPTEVQWDTIQEQPTDYLLRSEPANHGGIQCGYYTKILDTQLPQFGTQSGQYNMTGEGFIEILGRTTGTWQFPTIDVAVEAVFNPQPLWSPNTYYTAGTSVVAGVDIDPTTGRPVPNQWTYSCTQSGTSGSTSPTWPVDQYGNLTTGPVQDGSVVWQAVALNGPTPQNPAADFTFVAQSVPPGTYNPMTGATTGRFQHFFFMDPMNWGMWQPNRIRVWVRKRNGCNGDPYDGPPNGPGNFYVGERYLSLKVVPTDSASCYTTH